MTTPEYQIGAVNNQPSTLNYLSGNKFKFVIRKLVNTNFTVQEANIPAITIGVASQPTPLNPLPLPGNNIEFENLNVTFIVDEKLDNYREIWNWMDASNSDEDQEGYSLLIKQNIGLNPPHTGGLFAEAILHILDNHSNPIVNVHFYDCFPIQLSGITFSTTLSDETYRTAIAAFKYAYYEFEDVNEIRSIPKWSISDTTWDTETVPPDWDNINTNWDTTNINNENT